MRKSLLLLLALMLIGITGLETAQAAPQGFASQQTYTNESGTQQAFTSQPPAALAGQNILLLPLDSRPVNTQYISLLGNMVGATITYPQEGLDDYLTPGNYEQLKKFLQENIAKADALIIGVPQWLNGSLIESRHAETYVNNAQRLQELKSILAPYRQKPIYLLHVLPREFPSYAKEAYTYRYPLAEYGKVYDRLLRAPAPEAKQVYQEHLEQISKTIPAAYLKEYGQLFSENLKVQQELVKWVKEGLVDFLVIGMDDTSSEGLAQVSKRQLQAQIAKEKLEEQAFVLSGTDELSALLLAKYKNEHLYSLSTYELTFSDEAGQGQALIYDGQPLKEMIEEKVRFLQPSRAYYYSEPIHLYIHSAPETIDRVRQWAQNHQDALKGVADLAEVNRSDVAWMQEYFASGLDRQIESYAAWNTGSNAVGLVMAHLEMLKDTATWNEAHQQWMLIRYLEDHFFYSLKRPQLTQTRNSLDRLAVEDQQQLATQLKQELNQDKETFSVVTRRNGAQLVHQPRYQIEAVHLPWGRLFEVMISLKGEN